MDIVIPRADLKKWRRPTSFLPFASTPFLKRFSSLAIIHHSHCLKHNLKCFSLFTNHFHYTLSKYQILKGIIRKYLSVNALTIGLVNVIKWREKNSCHSHLLLTTQKLTFISFSGGFHLWCIFLLLAKRRRKETMKKGEIIRNAQESKHKEKEKLC